MLLMISGLSGAGKSTALHALEDLGFFCTDNLPVEMLSQWTDNVKQHHKNAAVCIDIRSSSDPGNLHHELERLRKAEAWQLLFIEASDDVLLRRFSTLRRRHPISTEKELISTISDERQVLTSLRDHSNLVLDSSNLNPYELAEQIEAYWREQCSDGGSINDMVCSIISFSYQRGLPPAADMVVDMRFLPNPHYVPELAPLTGRDQEVVDFFAVHDAVEATRERLCDWIGFIWPQLKKERKRYFTLAIGCSGGRHRSVFMAEQVADWIRKQGIATPVLRHRELLARGEA